MGQISNEIQTAAKEYNRLLSGFNEVSMENNFTEKVEKSKGILNKATTKELYQVFLSDIGVHAKQISMQIIIERDDKKILKEMFKKNVSINDQGEQQGCVRGEDPEFGNWTLNSPLFWAITTDENTDIKNLDVETPVKRELIDHILSTKPVNINLLRNIHNQIPKNKKYYREIRKLVSEERRHELLVYISYFKKQSDKLDSYAFFC